MKNLTFVTSDLHIGHSNVIEYCKRPFNDVNHMTSELIKRWNETVHNEDTVFVIGDLAMGQLEQTVPLLAALNGDKRLIPGNHDAWHPLHKRFHSKPTKQLYIDAGFTIEPWSKYVGIINMPVELTHYPYAETVVDRVVLHGHIHSGKRGKHDGYQVDIGVDAWDYRPVLIQDAIEEALHGSEYVRADHHAKDDV